MEWHDESPGTTDVSESRCKSLDGMILVPDETFTDSCFCGHQCYAYFCLLAVLADRKWILTDNQVEGNMKYSLSRVSTKRAVLRWERRSAKFVM